MNKPRTHSTSLKEPCNPTLDLEWHRWIKYDFLSFLLSFYQIPGQVSRENRREIWQVKASQELVKTLLIVVITYALCWAPNQFVFFAHNMGAPVDFSKPYYHFSVICAVLNSCVNPFIYGFKNKPFQRGFRKAILCQKRTKVMPGGTSHTESSVVSNFQSWEVKPLDCSISPGAWQKISVRGLRIISVYIRVNVSVVSLFSNAQISSSCPFRKYIGKFNRKCNFLGKSVCVLYKPINRPILRRFSRCTKTPHYL